MAELAAGEATYVARAEPDGEHAVLEAQPEGIAWRLPLGTAGTGALLGRAFTSPPSQDWSRALERLRAWGIA